jgi:hypothetical protein
LEIQGQDDEPLRFELPVEPFHCRHLLAARDAPRRPEIEEDHPAAEILKADAVPVLIGPDQGRCSQLLVRVHDPE